MRLQLGYFRDVSTLIAKWQQCSTVSGNFLHWMLQVVYSNLWSPSFLHILCFHYYNIHEPSSAIFNTMHCGSAGLSGPHSLIAFYQSACIDHSGLVSLDLEHCYIHCT